MGDDIRESLKIVLAGERRVGKTSLGVMYMQGSIPFYLPRIDNDDLKPVIVEGVEYNTRIHDTGGGEDYKRLRPLSYPGAEAFLLCFSVDRKESLERISSVYIPEVHHHCPRAPAILVACKIDLRETSEEETIASYEGSAMARGLGCQYCETSAVNNTGVEECFLLAAKEAVHFKATMKRKSKTSKCRIL